MNIEKESFVKIIQRKSIKDYLFYLTYNNRARIIEEELQVDTKTLVIKDKYNREILQEQPLEISPTNKFITNTNNLNYKNNIQFTVDYNKSLKSESKGVIGGIKSLEMIMSFSYDFNELMLTLYDLNEWEMEYEYITTTIIKKHLNEFKHFISFYHNESNGGQRIHNHTLIYPYIKNDKKLYLPTPHIHKDILNKIKMDFNIEAKKLIEKNQYKIKKLSLTNNKFSKYNF